VKKEKSYRHFKQDDAMAHIANNSDALDEVNDKLVISQGLWPPQPPDLNP
jgi:hypothetical protein